MLGAASPGVLLAMTTPTAPALCAAWTFSENGQSPRSMSTMSPVTSASTPSQARLSLPGRARSAVTSKLLSPKLAVPTSGVQPALSTLSSAPERPLHR